MKTTSRRIGSGEEAGLSPKSKDETRLSSTLPASTSPTSTSRTSTSPTSTSPTSGFTRPYTYEASDDANTKRRFEPQSMGFRYEGQSSTGVQQQKSPTGNCVYLFCAFFKGSSSQILNIRLKCCR